MTNLWGILNALQECCKRRGNVPVEFRLSLYVLCLYGSKWAAIHRGVEHASTLWGGVTFLCAPLLYHMTEIVPNLERIPL
jgi:hypothetical protein